MQQIDTQVTGKGLSSDGDAALFLCGPNDGPERPWFEVSE